MAGRKPSTDEDDPGFQDLLHRRKVIGRWSRARQPKKIKNVIAQVMQRRGYAQIEYARQLEEAWRRVAGEKFNQETQVGVLRRGTLEVVVSGSLMMQELSFEKQNLLSSMQEALPDSKIQKLRFRVGAIS